MGYALEGDAPGYEPEDNGLPCTGETRCKASWHDYLCKSQDCYFGRGVYSHWGL